MTRFKLQKTFIAEGIKASAGLADCRAIVALAFFLGMSACKDYGSSAQECWNPKLLRVKVGDTIFDLPHGVDLSPWEGKDPDGLLSLRFKDWSGNRQTCQRKDRVPLDYGPRAKLLMKNRPVERDYINGSLLDVNDASNQQYLNFGRYARYPDPFSELKTNSEYLSDYRDAASSIFVKSIADKRNIGVEIHRYDFVHDLRKYSTRCQIWADNPSAPSSRPPFPYNCIPGWRFLMGNLIVEINAQEEIDRPEDGTRLIAPPEQWPRKWAAVLEEISTYRVNPQGSDQP